MRDLTFGEAQTTETVAGKAYRLIRADIIFGRLAPGERLILDRMRDAYQVSVSTLREMLNRLSGEGLVVAEGSRGFEVAPISEPNLREISAMLCLLEGHALRLSFESGDMDWEGDVVAAHHKLASMKRMAARDRSKLETLKHYDREFHRALIAACGSRVLLETHAQVYDRYLRYEMLDRTYVAAGGRATLIDCALNRDWKTAQTALARDAQISVDRLIDKGLVR